MKLFYDDIRDKKRTASGIHHRTGSRGYVGKMLTPTDFMSRKEKREYQKNGEVRVYNMNTILLYDEFKTLPVDEQKSLLERWREKYTNEIIRKNMAISNGTLYRIVSELGIEVKKRASNIKKQYSLEEIEGFKNDVISYETFKTLIPSQQREVFEEYDRQFTTEELAEFWKVDRNVIYNVRVRMKAKRETEIAKNQTETTQKETNAPCQEYLIEKEEISNVAQSEPISVYPQFSGFQTKLSGDFHAKELANKLRKLADFVEHDENEYRIDLKLVEK